MSFFADSRRRWYLLAAAWVLLIVLGYGGFVEQSREENLGRGFLDNLYVTLQLAVLSYSDSASSLNWRLEVARFAAPLMAAGTLVQAASVVFREQFERYRHGRLKGHTVVAGLGMSGTRLALALAEEGRPVIGIDSSGPGLAALRAHDIPCLAGDPADPAVLRSVRVDRASGLVALCNTDAKNVAVATAARSVPRPKRSPDLRCSIHLEDAELTAYLRGSDLGGDEQVRIEFFNMHERGARALLAQYPIGAHLVVVGLGQLGRSVVLAAAQQWMESGEGPLVATLIDREVHARWQAMEMQHPALVEAVKAELLSFDVEAPDHAGLAELTARLSDPRPSLVAVVLDDESLALATGLFLHGVVDDETVPVVVRTRGDEGLGEVVGATDDPARSRYPGLHLFPLLDRTCSPAIIEGGVREQLARSLYEDHLARAAQRGVDEEPWLDLGDDQREGSREAADALIDGLTLAGFELLPLRHWGAPQVEFTPEEIEQLSAFDHERWRQRRAAEGWTFGLVREAAEKVTPQLVPWEELRPAWRDYNRTRIMAVPALLARAGFELDRR